MARARGSYPRGHWFESSLCHFLLGIFLNVTKSDSYPTKILQFSDTFPTNPTKIRQFSYTFRQLSDCLNPCDNERLAVFVIPFEIFLFTPRWCDFIIIIIAVSFTSMWPKVYIQMAKVCSTHPLPPSLIGRGRLVVEVSFATLARPQIHSKNNP